MNPESVNSEPPRSIDFARPWISDDDINAVCEVLRRGWITTGKEVLSFEEELSEYLEGPEVVAVSSATAALEVCLAALNLPPGSLIAVPTWTFASTGLAVQRVGHRVMLMDVSPYDLNISVESVGEAIDAGAVAVMPVHFGGLPVDSKINEICREAGVFVVEDAAHALGAYRSGSPVNGSGAAAACFSFYATKNLTSAEGGAIATFDPELALFARSYRLHGLSHDAWARYMPDSSSDEYDLVYPGIKANMPDILAALARSQLRRFGEMQRHRGELSTEYYSCLDGNSMVQAVPPSFCDDSAHHLMVIMLEGPLPRNIVRENLRARGVSTSVHFRPLHRYQWFRDNALVPASGLSNAERQADRVMSLPLHCGLTRADVHYICESLADAQREC